MMNSLNIIKLVVLIIRTQDTSCEVETEYASIVQKKFLFQLVKPLKPEFVTTVL